MWLVGWLDFSKYTSFHAYGLEAAIFFCDSPFIPLNLISLTKALIDAKSFTKDSYEIPNFNTLNKFLLNGLNYPYVYWLVQNVFFSYVIPSSDPTFTHFNTKSSSYNKIIESEVSRCFVVHNRIKRVDRTNSFRFLINVRRLTKKTDRVVKQILLNF